MQAYLQMLQTNKLLRAQRLIAWCMILCSAVGCLSVFFIPSGFLYRWSEARAQGFRAVYLAKGYILILAQSENRPAEAPPLPSEGEWSFESRFDLAHGVWPVFGTYERRSSQFETWVAIEIPLIVIGAVGIIWVFAVQRMRRRRLRGFPIQPETDGDAAS